MEIFVIVGCGYLPACRYRYCRNFGTSGARGQSWRA